MKCPQCKKAELEEIREILQFTLDSVSMVNATDVEARGRVLKDRIMLVCPCCHYQEPVKENEP